jgi:mannose-6-phosphate isomerase-like protein (cupin superfamily)
MSIIEDSVTVGVWDPSQRPRQVEKVWGKEFILPIAEHTVKYMYMHPNAECSLHFHRDKAEVFTLIQGKLEVTFFDSTGKKHTTILENILDSLILPPCTPHTFKAVSKEPAIFVESSTLDDPSDSYRLSRSKINEEDPNNRRLDN